jgi:hypothetical protein
MQTLFEIGSRGVNYDSKKSSDFRRLVIRLFEQPTGYSGHRHQKLVDSFTSDLIIRRHLCEIVNDCRYDYIADNQLHCLGFD